MPRLTGTSSSSEEVNGRNGSGRHVEAFTESSHQTRRMITVQAIFGSTTDARVLYFSLPGSTGDRWSSLERMMDPIRRYVVDGDEPYVGAGVAVQQYEGIPTPAGDCAEDSLPAELRNPYREEAKRGVA